MVNPISTIAKINLDINKSAKRTWLKFPLKHRADGFGVVVVGGLVVDVVVVDVVVVGARKKILTFTLDLILMIQTSFD